MVLMVVVLEASLSLVLMLMPRKSFRGPDCVRSCFGAVNIPLKTSHIELNMNGIELQYPWVLLARP